MAEEFLRIENLVKAFNGNQVVKGVNLAFNKGEFTIASLLNVQVFGVYMQNIGANRAFEPAALAVISFVITWGAMGMIQLLARFAPKTARI